MRFVFFVSDRLCSVLSILFFCLCILHLQACTSLTPASSASAPSASAPSTTSVAPIKEAADFFVPRGVFEKLEKKPDLASVNTSFANSIATHQTKSIRDPSKGIPRTSVFVPEVLLYLSPVTRDFYATGGLDIQANTRVWEVFLNKYKINYKLVTTVDQLEKSATGVLLLPSSVALSDREKQAVSDFRSRGGSVLASWLTGVRNEKGAWRGFDFMNKVLNVDVLGDTKQHDEDNFLMPYGDSPINNDLPAGLRIWIERSKIWYPLRMRGAKSAAAFMDWSRTFSTDKSGAAIVFDENKQASGVLSRVAVLGYPEYLWLAADPKYMEAIAHNTLMWLLRQPDAYKTAWPFPYTSAFVMAVEATEVIEDIDLSFAKMMEDAGGRATYYLLGENIKKSSELLKKIQAQGHELAYFGDRFEGFQGQPAAEQAKRLEAMRKAINDAGLKMPEDAGFHAPTDSYDINTQKLLSARGFGSFLAFNDFSDARLPFVAAGDTSFGGEDKSLVVLPRTQNGPEESMEEGDPSVGLKNFLDELKMTEEMAALSIARIPSQSLLTEDELAKVFKHLKDRRDRMWLATASQVAHWWRERERVDIQLESGISAPVLTVVIKGRAPIHNAAMVWINLPESNSSLRLVAKGKHEKLPKIVNIDVWRAAVVLEGWQPGKYVWEVHFDHP
jgi:Polysaccharide deacetylase